MFGFERLRRNQRTDEVVIAEEVDPIAREFEERTRGMTQDEIGIYCAQMAEQSLIDSYAGYTPEEVFTMVSNNAGEILDRMRADSAEAEAKGVPKAGRFYYVSDAEREVLLSLGTPATERAIAFLDELAFHPTPN